MGLRLCISKKLQEMQVLLTLAPESKSQGIRKLTGEGGQAENEGRGFYENIMLKRRKSKKLIFLHIIASSSKHLQKCIIQVIAVSKNKQKNKSTSRGGKCFNMTQDSLKLSNQPQNHVNEKCSLCSESNQEAKGAIYLMVIFFFWLCCVMVALCRLFLVVASGSYSLLQYMGFSLRWFLLLLSTSLSSCGM